MPDTSYIGYIGHMIDTVSPSWPLVILLLGLGLLFPAISLVRNSTVVAAIIEYFKSHNAMAVTVQEIRADQKQSNLERQEQSTAIENIGKRMDKLENDVSRLTCANSASCTNRRATDAVS